jgi:hypothetical protein
MSSGNLVLMHTPSVQLSIARFRQSCALGLSLNQAIFGALGSSTMPPRAITD